MNIVWYCVISHPYIRNLQSIFLRPGRSVMSQVEIHFKRTNHGREGKESLRTERTKRRKNERNGPTSASADPTTESALSSAESKRTAYSAFSARLTFLRLSCCGFELGSFFLSLLTSSAKVKRGWLSWVCGTSCSYSIHLHLAQQFPADSRDICATEIGIDTNSNLLLNLQLCSTRTSVCSLALTICWELS